MITRKDLYDHIMSNGCAIEKLQGINNTSNAIKIWNPKTNRRAFLNTPIGDQIVAYELAQNICVRLGIPIIRL